MMDSTSHPTTASGRPHHRTARRSAVVASLVVLIVGTPLVARALADDGGASVPTGATAAPAVDSADTARTFTPPAAPASASIAEGAAEETVDTAPETPAPETPAPDASQAVVADPPLDVHALLTDSYTWDERSLRVAALQQVLHVDVDGWYDADTRLVHLESLAFIGLGNEGVPEVAPPGPTAEEWAALRNCESGGDYSIVSSSGRYRGAYQFGRSTWDSVAERNNPLLVGVDPAAASAAEQDAMALARLPRSRRRPVARLRPSPVLTTPLHARTCDRRRPAIGILHADPALTWSWPDTSFMSAARCRPPRRSPTWPTSRTSPSGMSAWTEWSRSRVTVRVRARSFDVAVNLPVGTMTLRYDTVAYDAKATTMTAFAENFLLTSEDTITVVPDGAGSIVTYDAVLKMKGLLGLSDPLLGLTFNQIGDRATAGLIEALAGERIDEPAASAA